jgi:hypothetical protein
MADNVEQVKMSDGRTVAFAGKRKAIKSSDFVNGEVQVRIDFRNGETRLFTIPSSLTSQAACHGGEQKYGDSYAGVDDIEDMIAACEKVQENLAKGDWSARVEGSGIAGTSVLARALVEATGKTMEQVKAFLGGKTQADKMALRQSSKLKPIIERLEAEKVAKASKVDTNALFAELGV